MTHEQVRVAVLDDYQHVALKSADWSSLASRAVVTVFDGHVSDPAELIEKLRPFEVICVMRERTPLSKALIEALPKLRLIASTGPINASIDMAAAKERGIRVMHTRYDARSTVELTWALILASSRELAAESRNLRNGGWQIALGDEIHGKTLGLLGLGNIGSEVARIGHAFGMRIIAWSENLTDERAAAQGVTRVTKEQLFNESDILSVHLILSRRTRGLVGAKELASMAPSARLINTSRGPIIDEQALIEALREKRIAGAAIDVFDNEPLPLDHPFRSLENVLATPHIGYVARGLYEKFYSDTVKNISEWLYTL